MLPKKIVESLHNDRKKGGETSKLKLNFSQGVFFSSVFELIQQSAISLKCIYFPPSVVYFGQKREGFLCHSIYLASLSRSSLSGAPRVIELGYHA